MKKCLHYNFWVRYLILIYMCYLPWWWMSDYTTKTIKRLACSIKKNPIYSCTSNGHFKCVWLPTWRYIAWQIVSTHGVSTYSVSLLRSYLSNIVFLVVEPTSRKGYPRDPSWKPSVQRFYKRYIFIHRKWYFV